MSGHRILLSLASFAAAVAVAAVVAVAIAAMATLSACAAPGHPAAMQDAPLNASRAPPLIDKVRAATDRNTDVSAAFADGRVRATPCVSGPDFGAIGVHFVLPNRLGDATLEAPQLEAHIYEPLSSRTVHLVGVRCSVMASARASYSPSGAPTALEVNLLNYVAAPNRFGKPAFCELQVWV
jgi:hypothetical protein